MPRKTATVSTNSSDLTITYDLAQTPDSLVELKYSAEDMEKLDQFAIGLLYDGTGNYSHTSAGLVQRVRDAYLRAEVMLTVRKEIAALEVSDE